MRKYLTDVRAGNGVEQRKTTHLRARIDALLSNTATPDEWYDVTRRILQHRLAAHQLFARLTRNPPSGNFGSLASRLIVRSGGPLFDDAGLVGEAARAFREALRDFQDWTLDTTAILSAFPTNVYRGESGEKIGLNPELMPPGFSSGQPGRYLRATRGLLFETTEGAVVDPAEMFLRSGSLASLREGLRATLISDVLDVYWMDARPIELSEVEGWVTELAARLAPGARRQCSAQAGPRYRSGLRLSFEGDVRPAGIGGVLAAWPGAPDGVDTVLMRLYLEPWAQIRSGQVVIAEEITRCGPDTRLSSS